MQNLSFQRQWVLNHDCIPPCIH